MSNVLSKRKPQVQALYLQRVQEQVPLPSGLSLPTDPQEALNIGLRLGRSSGYGDGLVDGTELGLDVVLEVMDTLMDRPVFAWGGTPPVSC